MRYFLNYKKTVYGFTEIVADNLNEAKQRFIDGLCDEIDNKSEYEYEEDEKGDYKIQLQE